MLVEDYMNSLERPFNALKFLSDIIEYELLENYSRIKKGDEENSLDKILAILYALSALVEYLQKDREEIRKIVNENYYTLRKEEI